MRVVHAADLHIDSPMVGLEQYPGCPAATLRSATRRAFDNVVALCLREEAALLVLAGDIFDGDWRDYHSGLYFHAALAPLAEAGTRVLLVRGNHDAANEMTRSLRPPPHVHVYAEVTPTTWVDERLGVAVHGMSYPQRDVRTDLVPAYPAPLPGLLNLGLLHTNVGALPGHANYAPSSLTSLLAKGYDYWALGHVHQHEILGRAPWVVYPGNTQGRSVRETGPKGVQVIDVDDASRRITGVRRVETDVARWAHLRVSVGEDDGVEEIVHTAVDAVRGAVAAAGRLLAVRLELVGVTRAHQRIAANPEGVAQQLRADIAGLGAEIWVEKIKLHTRAPSTGAPASDGVTRELQALIAELESDPTQVRTTLAEDLRALESVQPLFRAQDHESEGVDVPEPAQDAWVASLLPRARDLLLARLGGGAA